MWSLKIFPKLLSKDMLVTIEKELGEYFQRLHFWNQWVPLIKMHCRVHYSLDFDLKIRSGQVCLMKISGGEIGHSRHCMIQVISFHEQNFFTMNQVSCHRKKIHIRKSKLPYLGPLDVVWQVSFGCWITWSILSWQESYKCVFFSKIVSFLAVINE